MPSYYYVSIDKYCTSTPLIESVSTLLRYFAPCHVMQPSTLFYAPPPQPHHSLYPPWFRSWTSIFTQFRIINNVFQIFKFSFFRLFHTHTFCHTFKWNCGKKKKQFFYSLQLHHLSTHRMCAIFFHLSTHSSHSSIPCPFIHSFTVPHVSLTYC